MNADSEPEFQETTCVTFEWTLRGLKALFESTKGEHKSKVTKSPLFGGGRWQILFYANSGLPKDGGAEGNYVSLYLACEPTTEEKEAAISDSARWAREGVFKFSFELRNPSKRLTYNTKEAQNHSFSWKNANWGWAQFAGRDTIYYQAQSIKSQDALVIICTITSSPYVPPAVPLVPRRSVPKSLVDTMGSLLDDPVYSDVEFIIPRHPNTLRNAQIIYASKKLLQRVDYFDAMFGANFAEGTSVTPFPIGDRVDKELTQHVEDSDQEDEELENADSIADDEESQSDAQDPFAGYLAVSAVKNDDVPMQESGSTDDPSLEEMSLTPSSRNSHITELVAKDSRSEKTKMQVIVRDAAYVTYRAMLYYLYTDFIIFAPLSSTFSPVHPRTPPTSSTNISVTNLETQGPTVAIKKSNQTLSATTSRKEWIDEWLQANPGRPKPCSPKAIYRIADRLGLIDLKDRAAQHIYKSLTVDNIAYEVFSPFSATHDEIRKVLVRFFLNHWQNIRNSESMKNVWKQIRGGRHPGFEEVWPVIVENLEFRPSSNPNEKGSSPEDVTKSF